MEVSKQLKKQIIIELFALLFLIAVIIYAIFSIQKSSRNSVTSQDGLVIVVDSTKVKNLVKASDGEALDLDGITYTITNNNDYAFNYSLIVIPNVHDEDVINQIRISTDNLYPSDLSKLVRKNGGYVVTSYSLEPGYTKVHSIKLWYKLDTDDELLDNKVDFEYRVIKD